MGLSSSDIITNTARICVANIPTFVAYLLRPSHDEDLSSRDGKEKEHGPISECRERRGGGTLLIDGEQVGSMTTDNIFWLLISWSGLDIGFDRGTTVCDYRGRGAVDRFEYTGTLSHVTVELDDDQDLDHEAAGAVEMSRE